MFCEDDLVYEWQWEEFSLQLFFNGEHDSWGKCKVGYRFYDCERLMFEGNDFSPAADYEVDTEEVAFMLLGFLVLDPSENDPELFLDYTEEQLAWAAAPATEQLRFYVQDQMEALEIV